MTPEEFEATDREKLYEAYTKAIDALEKAYTHLEYCGYGDAWERSCVMEQSPTLKQVIEEVLVRAGRDIQT